LKKNEIPLSECLKDTSKRFLPYWKKEIVPEIKKGQRIIISAHGNSLRALVQHIDKISNKDIINLNIPTGIPLVYELDKNMKPIKSYYLGDREKIRKATEMVKNQIRK
ncbi:MAG: 2,3-bisphosphoglycerate-dependent phosphoglycerate mutase, partial [Candidatus Paceibacterota bacterium]|jgi:2,3-bisphosphoglycerate-dependent phosphoglycerate mutase